MATATAVPTKPAIDKVILTLTEREARCLRTWLYYDIPDEGFDSPARTIKNALDEAGIHTYTALEWDGPATAPNV